MWQIEPFGDDLRADDNVDRAVVQFAVAFVDRIIVIGVSVKASNFFVRKESGKFCLYALCADAFVDDVGIMTLGAISRHAAAHAADMTRQLVAICVEGEGYGTAGAASLPAAALAECG